MKILSMVFFPNLFASESISWGEVGVVIIAFGSLVGGP